MDHDDAPRARLHLTADLAAGAVVATTPEQAQYLGAVLRLKPGATLALFNGRDGEWLATVRELKKGRALVEVGPRRREQTAERGPWVAFAPIKKDRLDFLVEKCTELGASRLVPVLTERTVIGRVNVARLRAQAVEAAEQSERLTVPEVAEPVALPQFVAGFPADWMLLVGDESGGGRPLAEVARRGDACLLVGPEGGFTGRELQILASHPFVCRVGLGPRILRAETAAVAALACWQMLVGDGVDAPHREQGR